MTISADERERREAVVRSERNTELGVTLGLVLLICVVVWFFNFRSSPPTQPEASLGDGAVVSLALPVTWKELDDSWWEHRSLPEFVVRVKLMAFRITTPSDIQDPAEVMPGELSMNTDVMFRLNQLFASSDEGEVSGFSWGMNSTEAGCFIEVFRRAGADRFQIWVIGHVVAERPEQLDMGRELLDIYVSDKRIQISSPEE